MKHPRPSLWPRFRQTLAKLHADQRGAEGLEKLLIIAAVVLPLLGVLLFFRDEIQAWVTERFDEIQDAGGRDGPPPGI